MGSEISSSSVSVPKNATSARRCSGVNVIRRGEPSPRAARRATIVAPQAGPRFYAHVVRALILTMISFAAIWIALTGLGVSTSLAGARTAAGG